MRVRMLRDHVNCDDGIIPVLRRAGQSHEVPEALARIWLERGICEEDKMLDGPEEVKVHISMQNENKAIEELRTDAGGLGKGLKNQIKKHRKKKE